MTRFSLDDLPEKHRSQAEAAINDQVRQEVQQKTRRSIKQRPEEALQRELIRTARGWPMVMLLDESWEPDVRHTVVLDWLYHVPNQRGDAAQRGILAAMGVKAGVWDLHLMIATEEHPGLYMELKADNNDLTDAQQTFKERAELMGYACLEVRSGKQFQAAVEQYLIGAKPFKIK